GGGGEEVPPAVPVLRLVPVHKPDVGFVDQGRGLEGLADLLVGHLLGRQPPQLVIDERQELLGGVLIALLQGPEDAGDLVHKNKPTGLREVRATYFLTGIQFGHVSSRFSRSRKMRLYG